jgi:heterodisulfide reductase subunit A
MPGVHCAVHYKYMCSEPGQQLIHQKINELGLDAVVVAACSPHMHLKTFRNAVASVGINPFLCEVANVREHCSWVHPNKDEATAKAGKLIRMAVEKVKHNHALTMIEVPVTKWAMVIGGGVAGIQAALDIASAGHEVILVEKVDRQRGRNRLIAPNSTTLSPETLRAV